MSSTGEEGGKPSKLRLSRTPSGSEGQATIAKLESEKKQLKEQNAQLWTIIEKQRKIIATLQQQTAISGLSLKKEVHVESSAQTPVVNNSSIENLTKENSNENMVTMPIDAVTEEPSEQPQPLPSAKSAKAEVATPKTEEDAPPLIQKNFAPPLLDHISVPTDNIMDAVVESSHNISIEPVQVQPLVLRASSHTSPVAEFASRAAFSEKNIFNSAAPAAPINPMSPTSPIGPNYNYTTPTAGSNPPSSTTQEYLPITAPKAKVIIVHKTHLKGGNEPSHSILNKDTMYGQAILPVHSRTINKLQKYAEPGSMDSMYLMNDKPPVLNQEEKAFLSLASSMGNKSELSVNAVMQQAETTVKQGRTSNLEDVNPGPNGAGNAIKLKTCINFIIPVVTSFVKSNDRGREMEYFAIAMLCDDVEQFRVEKSLNDFYSLDQHFKMDHQEEASNIRDLPSPGTFAAPSMKFEGKKKILELYLRTLRELDPESSDLLRFLATNVIPPVTCPQMEGYLGKKGKNFGSKKKRFYTLGANYLEYYENKDKKEKLGTFQIRYLTVREYKPSGYEVDFVSFVLTQYKAETFPCIGELPESDVVYTATLTADSQEDRDMWMKALNTRINAYRQQGARVTDAEEEANRMSKMAHVKNESLEPSPTRIREPSILAPKLTMPLQTDTSMRIPSQISLGVNLDTVFFDPDREHQRVMTTSIVPVSITAIPQQSRGKQNSKSKKSVDRQVFGVTLEQALNASRISPDYEIPAIVYRCIEYLETKDGYKEEGLYRLSGSNTTIKSLRDRFNTYHDVLLLNEDVDVHAVCSLFKSWLREIKGHILTEEFAPSLNLAAEKHTRREKIIILGHIISQLPLASYTLLRCIIAHLFKVVKNSQHNKMTARNLVIIFSPTLRIPGSMIALMMAEFHAIFDWSDDDIHKLDETPDEARSNDALGPLKDELATYPMVKAGARRNSQLYAAAAPDFMKTTPDITVPAEIRDLIDKELSFDSLARD